MAEDAIAKARAIAAKLGVVVAAGGGSALGKRGHDEAAVLGVGSLKKKKVYIPVDEHPDVNFLGLLIGPRGETQKQMQQMSGAKILIRGRGAHKDGMGPSNPHPDDSDALHVSIEGSDEAVEKALLEVEKILFNPEQALRLKSEQLKSLGIGSGGIGGGGGMSQYGPGGEDDGSGGYQVELRVPNNMVGLLIGKGGETIQRMQMQTGAHMQIAKESEMRPGETTRAITLKGTPASVAELKIKIEETLGGAASNKPQQAPQGGSELPHAYVIRIPVPNDKVGCIIGRGGMTVKGIQEKTRAHVHIPTGPDEDNPQVRTISVGADSKECADACQMEIFMVLQQTNHSSAPTPQQSAVNILVPDEKVGIIIGRGGSTIKDIQQRCGVRVQIPQAADPGSNPPVRTCSIIGPPEAQYVARFEIESILGLAASGAQYGGGGSSSAYQQQQQPQAGYYQPATVAPMYGQYAAYAADPYYAAAAAAGYQQLAYAQQQQQQQQPQMQQQQQQAEVPTDPTAYYTDFWTYASYYGEAAARAYYQAWSPPAGSTPPQGFSLPAAEAAAGTGIGVETAAGNTGASTTASGGQEQVSSESAASSSAEQQQQQQQSSSSSSSEQAQAEEAWDAYKKQYAEWWEAYGRASGAPQEPPRST